LLPLALQEAFPGEAGCRGRSDRQEEGGHRCRDFFETVRHIFVHAYYESDRPLHEQQWGGLRWASLPPVPSLHCSGKVAVVGHTPQKNGEILDLGCLKRIDTFCHGGGWLMALEVCAGKVWQATSAGERRRGDT
jgi:serine/threonine protein phosphatase 1